MSLKVLFLNTFDKYGGASIALHRTVKSLEKYRDIQAKILVQNKDDVQANVFPAQKGYVGKKKALFRFAMERLYFSWQEKAKEFRYQFSPANIGIDISKHKLVQEADILHLHWINFGFLSLKSLEKLQKLGKPIVWTLHDMWAFTGGCHYAKDCQNYEQSCGHCQFLKKAKTDDLSYKIHVKKQSIFSQNLIHFVTCSHWLKTLADKSSLLKNAPVRHIPNPIDTNFYKVSHKTVLQKKYHLQENKFWLLFGAMNIADKRKGFLYLKESLEILKNQYPEIQEDLHLLVFGKSSEEMLASLSYPTHNLGVIKEQEKMVEAYNLANAFIIPTLEDNLPNTVLESLACQTPVLGFEVGGVPEMVTHQENGFLATYKNSKDLAEGILWLWRIWKHEPKKYKILQENARNTILEKYNEKLISQQYADLYHSLFSK